MSNDARDLGSAKLVVRHVPEPDATYDPTAHDKLDHVTGFVQVGAEVDGVFIPIAQRKASGVFADIERAKQSKAKPAKTSE